MTIDHAGLLTIDSNMPKPTPDKAMDRIRSHFEKSGLTLHDLGVKMGYPAESARKSAWQFFKTDDPRLSMLRRFAKAMDMPIEELVSEKRKG